ncbi:hypothetical protein BT69DRAFT_129870 [Atractiella rhizophila]|nr:hypothetical protein BT69DRAFT_129870 [Atractiella rhizophila]
MPATVPVLPSFPPPNLPHQTPSRIPVANPPKTPVHHGRPIQKLPIRLQTLTGSKGLAARLQTPQQHNPLPTASVSRLPVTARRLPVAATPATNKHASGRQMLARIQALKEEKGEKEDALPEIGSMSLSPKKGAIVSPGKRRREDMEGGSEEEGDDWSNYSLEFGAIGRSPSPLKKRSKQTSDSAEDPLQGRDAALEKVLEQSQAVQTNALETTSSSSGNKPEQEKEVEVKAAKIFSICRSPSAPSALSAPPPEDANDHEVSDELNCIPPSPTRLTRPPTAIIRRIEPQGSDDEVDFLSPRKKLKIFRDPPPHQPVEPQPIEPAPTQHPANGSPVKPSLLRPPSPVKISTHILPAVGDSKSIVQPLTRQNKPKKPSFPSRPAPSLRRSQRRSASAQHVNVKPKLLQTTLSFVPNQKSKGSTSKVELKEPPLVVEKEEEREMELAANTSAGLARGTVDRLDSLDSLLSKLGTSRGFGATLLPQGMEGIKKSSFLSASSSENQEQTKEKAFRPGKFVDFDVSLKEDDGKPAPLGRRHVASLKDCIIQEYKRW